ncbi:unnamed protein product [Angiostrongylus costaricensis]|uniref:Tubulin-specific chaperone A n=1 Tax=Angiostrongylus costaricensis TaxID=334426 RepID=A0A158PEP4_ANGCS|nr:unnamed protein product [Angiostrongylus costaricensis]
MENILKNWKNVSWEDIQLRVDSEIKAIGIRQDEGEERRKVLVEESNKYRENTNKESRKVAIPLIKAFQNEVDHLTLRGKAIEAALIEICSQLITLAVICFSLRFQGNLMSVFTAPSLSMFFFLTVSHILLQAIFPLFHFK